MNNNLVKLDINNIINLINIHNVMLTVKQLLILINYNFNELYIDKFWDNIENDKWFYIDNEMLKYIGYSSIDINSAKRTYLLLLKDQFDIDKDYKLYNFKKFIEISKCVTTHLENNEINTHNKTKHLIVSPDCLNNH